ncbi:MAG: NAD(P)-dependent oxidoreductase [Hyphomicrobiales bacterium]|nr:NAD(P)-dependent oxidoreductase [Hyphomicrobiales bacterium]
MIIVTGGSGQLGRVCVFDLIEHGYDVTSIDVTPPTDPGIRFSRADLTDFGQAKAALSMIDERVEEVTGVVQLAAWRLHTKG